MDDDEQMEEDWEMTKVQPAGDDHDLFDDGEGSSSFNGANRQKGDGADTSCRPGELYLDFNTRSNHLLIHCTIVFFNYDNIVFS